LNVWKSHLRIATETLLSAAATQHEISRRTGVDRKTIRRIVRANSPGVAPAQSNFRHPGHRLC